MSDDLNERLLNQFAVQKAILREVAEMKKSNADMVLRFGNDKKERRMRKSMRKTISKTIRETLQTTLEEKDTGNMTVPMKELMDDHNLYTKMYNSHSCVDLDTSQAYKVFIDWQWKHAKIVSRLKYNIYELQFGEKKMTIDMTHVPVRILRGTGGNN